MTGASTWDHVNEKRVLLSPHFNVYSGRVQQCSCKDDGYLKLKCIDGAIMASQQDGGVANEK